MRLALLPLFVLLAAAPACAQPADPIGALLDHVPDEPDEAAEKAQPSNSVPEPPPLPAAPIPYAPPRPQLTAPVRLEETGKNPDAPPNLNDLAYETRLKSSFASAQGFQGPLDGGWTLSAKDAGDLYALQLVDRPDRLEGAWRDLRRKGALGASGLVDDIQRSGQDLTMRFAAGGADAVTAVLHGAEDGRWSGELTEGGKRRAVTLRRQSP
ncbi:MAG: hypothetical protein JWQ29_2986 [Phenylobacterium sp.]|nr:hypothetical protein [Phenylobacterium sp.]